MKAAYIEKFGGPEVLNYGDLPDPVAGAGSGRRRHRGRQHQRRRSGRCAPASTGQAKFPMILGRDFSGVVSAVGTGVQDLKVGDEVFGVLEGGRDGTYCEKIAVGAAIVAKKPASMRHVEAAALALTGLTALCAVEDWLKLKSGETILIQGGAGGVASFAIQVAKHHRCTGHHHRQRGQPGLSARARRRRGHRLQHDRFHQGREQLRRGVRYRGRRRRHPVVRRPQAGRTRRLHRVGRPGAEARAQRRDVVAAGRRPRPRRTRAHPRARRSAPSARLMSWSTAWRRLRRRSQVSAARHLKGKLVLKV